MTEAAHWPPPQEPPAGSSSEPGSTTNGVVLAHFGWRLLAFLADIANLFALFVGLLLVASFAVFSWASDTVATVAVGLIAVLTVWFRIKWEGSGGSPLRRAMGVWIVDETTLQPIGTGRGFVRAIVRLVSELVFYLGYLWMLWDPRRQTWHDKAARSIVVKR